ncbi:MAG: ABC transporter ATP-binding protein [Alcanivoracaceae bacterium]
MSSMLELEDIHFSWPRQPGPTLRIDALSVAPAEAVFLIGPSGCGKTTLLSLIAGILTPQQGRVYLDGQRLDILPASARDRLRADRLGIIFQLFNLLPYLSVRDNVLLSARFSPARAARAVAETGSVKAEAERLLDRLGLEPALWNRPATELSVGQQQRVAAARALLGRPALLLADEPTSALDSTHRDRFIRLLREEAEAAGSALLFVSHDVSLAGQFSRVLDLSTLNQAGREVDV